MLYKNGSLYQMTDAEKKELRTKFTFPLRLVYPPELIKTSRLNRLPDHPASINLPLRTVIQNSDGETEEWRWARNITQTQGGVHKYFPRRFNFQGNTSIPETQLEFLYFLYYKNPHCGNGALPKDQRKTVYYIIEDLLKIAQKRVDSRAATARYEVMVFDDELGLPEHRLRAIAKAYFIPRVDDLQLAQVRVAIDVEVRRDMKKGIPNFIEMSNSDEYIKLRGKIQIAIDRELIIFVPRDRVWAWKGDKAMGQNARLEDICRVTSKANAQQALIDWYEANLDFKQRLNTELEELTAMSPEDKRVHAASGAEDPE